jgi:hypothetical protein
MLCLIHYGETGLERIITPLSLLLSLLDRYRLSQQDLVIFRLCQLDLVIFDLFRLELGFLIVFVQDPQKSHYDTYSCR